MKNRITSFSICVAIICSAFYIPVAHMNPQENRADYKNPRLPVERRVADLLSRMTLEEKIAQLTCLWGNRPQVKPPGDFETDRGDFSPAKAAEVMKYGIGQIARQREQKDPRQGAMFANAVQKWLVELRDSVSRQFFLTKYFMATWRRAVRVFLNQLRWLPHGIPSSSRRFLLRERWKHARVEVIIMVGTSSVKYETVKLEVVAK